MFGSRAAGPAAVTVVIVTRNRQEEVLAAIRSALAQTAPVEVLVVDDGSTDGTPEVIERDFPQVRLHRRPEREEIVACRNRAAKLASAPVLVVIDDDAELRSPETVAQTIRDLDDPRIGAVAVPYVDVPRGSAVWQRAPDDHGVWVTDQFRAIAYAMPRHVFLALGGYRPVLVHGAEEPDFCIRLLDAGYVVRLGRADPIVHHGSPKRDLEKVWKRVCHNDVLFAWHNVPWRYMTPRIAKVSVHQAWLGYGIRRVGLFMRGVGEGLRLVAAERRNRRPVSRTTYRLYRRLGRAPAPIEEVEPLLPRPRYGPAFAS